jgi:glutaredoxin
MAKPAGSSGDWVEVVDRLANRVDRVMDRFRKAPRKRLLDVPLPPPAPNPFAAPPPAEATKVETPIGNAELPVQIYGRRSCMWSGRAVKVFQDLSIPAKFYDIDDPDQVELEARLIRETKQYQTPWIYLRGAFAGGYNSIDELNRLGQLEERTLPPEERGKSRSRIRLEVPHRPPEDGPEGERR